MAVARLHPLVVAVKGLERRLEASRELERIQLAASAAAFLGHVLADVLPEIAVNGHFVAGNVFGDGNARQFHDAALDRVHEREVADRPGEERPLGVTGAAEKEWGSPRGR